MFKNFLLRKMLQKQGMAEAQIDMLLDMMEKNPELFKTIAKEVEEKVKGGMDKTMAGMMVMKKHEDELKKLA